MLLLRFETRTCEDGDPNSRQVWSNFEIADMDFWRGPAYTAFFEYLDSKGGFYYEVRFLPNFPSYS